MNEPDATAAYFAAWSKMLREVSAGVPTVCVDLERVRRNAARVRKLAGARSVRISDKSVPAPLLLAALEDALSTERHMVFHAPFLDPTLRAFPHADILMGKPMPMFALEALLEHSALSARLVAQVAWLVDSQERLSALIDLAQRKSLPLRVSLEIDVGLHRGGFQLADFDAALAKLQASTLKLHGLMGYDAHVGKSLLAARVSHRDAVARYRAFVAKLDAAGLSRTDLCFNGAGSPTFFRHDEASPLTEISVGSIFLKPCEYDLPELEAFEPAAFIATPVLKVQDDLSLPDHTALTSVVSRASSLLGAALSKTVFHDGGRWEAKPVFPPGLRRHPAFSGSFNQEGLAAAKSVQVAVDDYVFFRPLQTENVLLRFGDWLVLEGSATHRWAHF